MNEQNDRAFEALAQDARVVRTARMLEETAKLQENQRVDIIERFQRFIEARGLPQGGAARQIGISNTTMSEVLSRKWRAQNLDVHLVKMNNWMELTARRDNILHNKKFVLHSVALEIFQVAGVLAENCKMGVVYGPAQIGKTMTLQAIEGDQRFGAPVLIRVDESLLRPFSLCRAVAAKLELKTSGTFDTVLRRIVNRLTGTKRMLMFDEVERVHYKTLELIRDIHDQTGCPVLLSGKPKIYDKLGYREVGDYKEVTDQLKARIAIRRDLLERTRGSNPKPLFTLDDIRKLIHSDDLKIHVAPDAVRWLQTRASTPGAGGLGNAIVCFYFASNVAWSKKSETITAADLDDASELTMGSEDAKQIAEFVAESSRAMRRVS